MFRSTSMRAGRSRKNRALNFETFEKRELMAADSANSIDFIKQRPDIRAAENEVIQTGEPKVVRVNGTVPSTQQQEHPFLAKANLGGSYTGEFVIKLENFKLVHDFNLRMEFEGRSRLSDIDLTAIASDVDISGRYESSIVDGIASDLTFADWNSKAITNVKVLSGPAATTDYTITSNSADGIVYPDQLSGLSTEELVGNTVRNAIPLQTSLINWGGETLERLSKIKIPNVDVPKLISGYKIAQEIIAPVGSRSNAEIYRSVLNNKSMLVGINSNADLERFAQGNVTTIVGASFKFEKEWNRVLTQIPIMKNVPIFGGLVTASLGTEANLGISVAIAGVFAADSRGWGLTEGTAASIRPRLEVLATGSVSIIGIGNWALIKADAKAGVFVEGRIWLEVGSLDTDSRKLVDGRILYVTANGVQKGSFASYLSARVDAEVGAKVETKGKLLGFTIWKTSSEKTWDVYKKTVFSARRSLSE
ncbi:MAG: hypothetical protein RL240_1611 [Planctomycetota bacterium]